MADPSLFDFMRIPASTLIALDNRTIHFAMQPYHYIVRLVHVVAMAAFFGAIGLLDFRLMGWRAAIPLRAFADHALPWLYATFGVAVATGIALFAYEPLRAGSRAYFTPKMAFIIFGLANALLFHRTGYLRAIAAEGAMPASAKFAGLVSFTLWTAVIACSSLNAEPAPKVLLR